MYLVVSLCFLETYLILQHLELRFAGSPQETPFLGGLGVSLVVNVGFLGGGLLHGHGLLIARALGVVRVRAILSVVTIICTIIAKPGSSYSSLSLSARCASDQMIARGLPHSIVQFLYHLFQPYS
jgi:hypothetical protein